MNENIYVSDQTAKEIKEMLEDLKKQLEEQNENQSKEIK